MCVRKFEAEVGRREWRRCYSLAWTNEIMEVQGCKGYIRGRKRFFTVSRVMQEKIIGLS